MTAPTTLEITAPNDFHHHFRDGEALQTTVALAFGQFQRVLAMPNLVPPVVTAEDARKYRERIEGGTPRDLVMTLYLTDKTTPAVIEEAWAKGDVKAVKLYPAGATTNSDFGITNYDDCIPALKKMAELGMVLCVHGESTDQSTDIFDRETIFYKDIMVKIIAAVPGLKIVCEHITTRDAVEFVKAAGDNVAATITAHHLLHNRNDIFKGGIRPHMYCLPVLKREDDRRALVEAATSGSKKFFAGTDSAPHPVERKESSCGCAGVFTAHAAMSFYAEAFDSVGALDKLEAFASHNGSDFYNLPRNSNKVRLLKKQQAIPESYDFATSKVVPLRAGGNVEWTLEWI